LSPTPSSISIIYTPSTAVSFPKPITVRRSSRAPKPCKVTQPPITPLSTPSALKEAIKFAQRQKPFGRKKTKRVDQIPDEHINSLTTESPAGRFPHRLLPAARFAWPKRLLLNDSTVAGPS